MALNSYDQQTAIGKALLLLEDLGRLSRNGPVRFTDLASHTGLRKPTLARILSELKQHGFVGQDLNTGHYYLDTKVLVLSSEYMGGFDIRARAKPYLEKLSDETGLAVHLAVRDNAEVVYIDKIESKEVIKVASGVGVRMPLHCTSLGKAILAFSGPEVKNAALSAGLKRITDRTITTVEALDAALEDIVRAGYSVDDMENEPSVRCIAAPVMGAKGEVIAAISISGTINQVLKSQVASFGRLVKTECANFSRSLGYVGAGSS